MPNINSSLMILLDSADRTDWERFMFTGLFCGITTNPKLLNQVGVDCTVEELANLSDAAFDFGAGEIHLQVWGSDSDSMLAVGRELAGIDPRVIVKVPITEDGIFCARQLLEEEINVTLTAVHSAGQILSVIALGATYAAPYLGRINDAGFDGIKEVAAMQQMITQFESNTRLLVASIRTMSDLVALATIGVNTFTISPKLANELLHNNLTIKAAEEFESMV